jgi:hypothetical protein
MSLPLQLVFSFGCKINVDTTNLNIVNVVACIINMIMIVIDNFIDILHP